MTKILIKSNYLFGGYRAYDKFPGLNVDQAINSHIQVEEFLKKEALNLPSQKVTSFPKINENAFSKTNANSLYLFNNSLIANYLVLENSFSSRGIHHTLIVASLEETNLMNDFRILKRVSEHPANWIENQHFKNEITLNADIKSLEKIIEIQPNLLEPTLLIKG